MSFYERIKKKQPKCMLHNAQQHRYSILIVTVTVTELTEQTTETEQLLKLTNKLHKTAGGIKFPLFARDCAQRSVFRTETEGKTGETTNCD